MSRFERQTTPSGELPAILGTATEEFRRSLEEHVRRIIETAEGHAAEIERGADAKAREREQQLTVREQQLTVRAHETTVRTEEAVQQAIGRASRVLDSIDLIQSAISGMLTELRAELKSIEQGDFAEADVPRQTGGPAISLKPPQREATATAREQINPPAPPAPPAPRPAATPTPTIAEPAAAAPAQPKPRVEPEPEQIEDTPPAEPDRNGASSAEFDQMIHAEIRRMYESGKTRNDVETFLGRLELGNEYSALLDELYKGGGSNRTRKGLFGRRREK
jgi:hypothetical protein